MARRKLSDQDKEEIRKMAAEGHTPAALALLYDVSRQTIYRTIDQDLYERTLAQSKEYYLDNTQQIREQRASARRTFLLSFHKEKDAAIIQQLDSQENVHDYIRTLVTKDMKRKKRKKKVDHS